MDGGKDEEWGFLLSVNYGVSLQNSVGYNNQSKASVAIDGDYFSQEPSRCVVSI
jgi:long-subunit fatty acid transport protein